MGLCTTVWGFPTGQANGCMHFVQQVSVHTVTVAAAIFFFHYRWWILHSLCENSGCNTKQQHRELSAAVHCHVTVDMHRKLWPRARLRHSRAQLLFLFQSGFPVPTCDETSVGNGVWSNRQTLIFQRHSAGLGEAGRPPRAFYRDQYEFIPKIPKRQKNGIRDTSTVSFT